jgi:hypothetical protein
VPVPEWAGEVTVRTLMAYEKDAWEESLADSKGKKVKIDMSNLRAKLCALTIVDDKGKCIFSEHDVVALGRKGAKAIGRVYDVAASLNGISEEDAEELVKNSGAIQSDDSSTS